MTGYEKMVVTREDGPAKAVSDGVRSVKKTLTKA